MSTQLEQEPGIRRSFLVIGGVAIAAAIVAFILMTFVLGGGDDPADAIPTFVPTQSGAPTASQAPGASAAPGADPTVAPGEIAGLTSGGVDPFRPDDVASEADNPRPIGSPISAAQQAAIDECTLEPGQPHTLEEVMAAEECRQNARR